jgi:ribonuclease VapC
MIASYLGDAMISAVNYQEAAKVLLNDRIPKESVQGLLTSLRLEILAHHASDAWEAALLYEATRASGSGLGDRTCMALAIKQGLPTITTDKAWAKLSIPGLIVILAR